MVVNPALLQNPTFHMYWDSVDSGVIFSCFLIGLKQILMNFGALETGVKFDDS